MQTQADTEPRRKLAAILSADAAGYSRLMGEDEAGTLATLTKSRAAFAALIALHRGRLVDTAGDSVLAVFDSVVEAVNCAADVQRDLREKNEALLQALRLEFRIGVNLGDVIEQADGTVYGDGVNVAARLQALADPGGICISGTAYDQVKQKIALDFDSLGTKSVKNIAEPVRVYRVRLPSDGDASRSWRARSGTKSFPRPFLAGVVVLILGIGAVGVWKYAHQGGGTQSESTTTLASTLSIPDKPSIAVLPFVNMSDDKEQEYFSDGMTEDVITRLSQLSGLFVISRNSVFTYKGKAVRPEQVSQELGVRYMLEGSVRKAGKRVRITAQLIDATNGYHLWAEKYDGDLEDIFGLQDRITRQIVTSLAPKLTEPEQLRLGRRETDSGEAYDAFLRGYTVFHEYTPESFLKAHRLFKHAIELDPNYARAYAWLAWQQFTRWEFQWTEEPGELDRSLAAAEKAVALDDFMADAHTILGWDLVWMRQHERGVAEGKRAVSLDPNSAMSHTFLAESLNFAGKPDEAIGYAEKAIRLDPNYPPYMSLHLGESYCHLRQYEPCISYLQDSLARNPNFLPARRWLAVAYVELGREKEARAEVAEIMRISPGASLENWRERLPYQQQATLDRFIGGLRKAGMK